MDEKKVSKPKKTNKITNLAFYRPNSIGRLLMDEKKVSNEKKVSKPKITNKITNLAFYRANLIRRLLMDEKKGK
jgi:hypothetical protein